MLESLRNRFHERFQEIAQSMLVGTFAGVVVKYGDSAFVTGLGVAFLAVLATLGVAVIDELTQTGGE